MSVEENKDGFGDLVSECASGVTGGLTMQNSERQSWLLLVVVWILAAAAAEAQEGPPPAAAAAPTTATTSVAPAPSPEQLGAMLGGAEFMLILDRPFAAEKLFNAVLSMDPKNAHALDGLRSIKLAKRTSWTFLAHGYADNLRHANGDLGAVGPGCSPSTREGHLLGGRWGLQRENLSGPGVAAEDHGQWDLGAVLQKLRRLRLYRCTISRLAPDRTLFNFKGTWNRETRA